MFNVIKCLILAFILLFSSCDKTGLTGPTTDGDTNTSTTTTNEVSTGTQTGSENQSGSESGSQTGSGSSSQTGGQSGSQTGGEGPLKTLPPPSFSVANNATISFQDTVTISAYENYQVRYTRNGSTPTRSSTLYNGPIIFTLNDCGTKTLKAIAIRGNDISEVASVTFTVKDTRPSVPTFSVADNSRLPSNSSITITATSTADICYTTNGATPTTSSAKYSGPISLSAFNKGAAHKIMAIAHDGKKSSEVATLNFVIPPDSPNINLNVQPNAKGYVAKGELNSVSLQADGNANIYYTTNGQEPTTASSLYSTASSAVILNQINNQNETLLKAISVKNGICSDVSTISFKVAPKPTVNFLMENQSTTSPYRRGNMVFKTSTPKYLLSINGGEWKTYNSGTKINIKTLSKEQNSLTVRVTDENTLLTNEKIFSISVDKDRTNPSKNLSCWMDWLDDNLPLQKLNIPGTHESGAWQAGGGAALCQSHGYSQQLANGIRVLDLRIHEDMAIYHGIFWQKHDLQFAMDEIKKFLANNPSEFLIVSIKDENGAGDQQTWTDNVNKVVASTGRLYTGNDYRVGALRGKFIIIRRFGYFNHGIRPGRWPNGDGKEGAPGYDESAHGTPLMRIQDRYGYSGFGSTQENDKKTKIDYLLNEAGRNPDDGILYISFISATGVPWKNPGAIAGVINPWFKEKLLIKKTEANNGIFYRWGVVMMDFITHSDHESVPGLYVNTNNFDAF